jgi:hypothetical protein
VIVALAEIPTLPTTPFSKSKLAQESASYIDIVPTICKKLFVPFFANTLCVYATPLVILTGCAR